MLVNFKFVNGNSETVIKDTYQCEYESTIFLNDPDNEVIYITERCPIECSETTTVASTYTFKENKVYFIRVEDLNGDTILDKYRVYQTGNEPHTKAHGICTSGKCTTPVITSKYYNYQKLGELHFEGKPTSNTPIEKTLTIEDSKTYSDIVIHIKGTVGTNVQVYIGSLIYNTSGATAAKNVNTLRIYHAYTVEGNNVGYTMGTGGNGSTLGISNNVLTASLQYYGGTSSGNDYTVTVYGKKFDEGMIDVINEHYA